MTTIEVDRHAEAFAEQRPYLFAVAYRLLGSAEDADDALQDAWLRFHEVDLDSIESPRAYLVTIVTRLCLDLLRSARRRREQYIGFSLPEPIPTSEALPEELAERTESASFAFMLLLERLNPVERAVLVLHDVFDYTHDEVGEAIGRTTAASRQALRRGRRKLGGANQPRTRPSAHTRELVARFFEASNSGDLEGLVQALASDVVLMSDGGGQVRAANRPLAGSGLVSRFMVAMSQMDTSPAHGEFVELNGHPAVLTYEDGALANAFLFEASAAGITAIYVVRNPDKLTRLAAPTASARSEEQAPSAESETLRAPPAEPKKKDSDAPTT